MLKDANPNPAPRSHALSQLPHPLLFLFHPNRLAVCSTSSASYPESLAASTTCVSCAGRACGTAATSPPWSVPGSTQTPRAAPMEAPPSPSPARPPPPPPPTPRPPPPPRARGAQRPGTFSPSASLKAAWDVQRKGTRGFQWPPAAWSLAITVGIGRG